MMVLLNLLVNTFFIMKKSWTDFKGRVKSWWAKRQKQKKFASDKVYEIDNTVEI